MVVIIIISPPALSTTTTTYCTAGGAAGGGACVNTMEWNHPSWRVLVLGIVAAFLGLTKGQNPEIVNDILPEVQRVGRTARLNCTVARLGQNVVQWSFVGSRNYIISVDRQIMVLNSRMGGIPQYQIVKSTQDVEQDRTTFQLVISRIRPEFSGRYECTIVLTNVRNFEHWTRKTGSLTVLYAPLIRPGSTTYVKMVDKGSDASIHCDAQGVPSPNITWTRSDGHLLPNGKALFRGKTLQIHGASVDYTGVYRCVADNNIKPPAEALVQVYVYQEPKVRVLQDSVGQHANGWYDSKLDCIVQGYPIPSVNWAKYDGDKLKYITNNDKYESSKQVTDMQNLMSGEQWYRLRIKNVQAADFKKYYCIAYNYKGTHNNTVTLFETYDCQGPLCYSMRADNKNNDAAISRLSPFLSLLMACVIALGICGGGRMMIMWS